MRLPWGNDGASPAGQGYVPDARAPNESGTAAETFPSLRTQGYISGCGRGYLPRVFPATGIVSQIYQWVFSGVSCEEVARRLNNLETGPGNRSANISAILRRGQCKN